MSFSPKSTYEREYYGVDWDDRLDVGETISTASVVASTIKNTPRDLNPSAIVSGSSGISGVNHSQLIVAGVRGVHYETLWRITTSAGRTLEERVTLIVY